MEHAQPYPLDVLYTIWQLMFESSWKYFSGHEEIVEDF